MQCQRTIERCLSTVDLENQRLGNQNVPERGEVE